MAFLFEKTVTFAILLKYYKKCLIRKSRREKRRKTIIFILFRVIPLTLVILCFHMIAVVVTYLLLIGRGSIITTGPLFVLSVLPSAFISSIARIVKRTVLDGKSMQTIFKSTVSI